MTFAEAFKKMPACLMGAVDNPKTIQDLLYAAQHEIDMAEEDQDGHLSVAEIRSVRRFLNYIRIALSTEARTRGARSETMG